MNKFPVRLSNVIAMTAFHLGAIVALFFVSWRVVILGCLSWYVFGCLGTTLTYHRLLTHRSFKTYLWVEYALAIIACLGLQGGSIKWVAQHRKHHKFTEVPGVDPHTPRDGKYWAHMGWMIWGDPSISSEEFLRKWSPDLYRHSFYRNLETFFWVPSTIWGLTCLWIGGLPYLLWGLAIPVVAGWHFTWLVNSGTHLWGYRNYDTPDDSRNNRWIALLTWGEGWHNNHHAKASRARHGLTWYELDITWLNIKLLEKIGLAWEVKS